MNRKINTLTNNELDRLKKRYELKKEHVKLLAKAFNISKLSLRKYAFENKWKRPCGNLKLYTSEKS